MVQDLGVTATLKERIFLSTGGISSRGAIDTALTWMNSCPWGFELSGGSHDPSLEMRLEGLASLRPILLHNYFPPPDVPFVLNLASQIPEIHDQSEQLVRRALALSSRIGARFFAVHAGYLIDPDVTHLGGKIPAQTARERSIGIQTMTRSLERLGELANSLGVRLLVENHALTQANLIEHGRNFLLLADPEEIQTCISPIQGFVGLLLDVGHLRVSAQALGFDAIKAMAALNPLVEGYHLSDNDGLSDSHGGISLDSWFMPYLRTDLEYYTIEVHTADTQVLLDSANAIAGRLGERTFTKDDL